MCTRVHVIWSAIMLLSLTSSLITYDRGRTLSLAFTILKSRLQAKKLVATTVCAHTVVDALAHSAIALT